MGGQTSKNGWSKESMLDCKHERKRAKEKKLELPREMEFGWREMHRVYFVKFWLHFCVMLSLVSSLLRHFSEDFLFKIEILSKIL